MLLYIDRRCFASALDGRPLVELDLRVRADEARSFVSSTLGDDSDYETGEIAMSVASEYLKSVYGLRDDQVDVEAMDGALLVEPHLLPPDERADGCREVSVAVGTLAGLAASARERFHSA